MWGRAFGVQREKAYVRSWDERRVLWFVERDLLTAVDSEQ